MSANCCTRTKDLGCYPCGAVFIPTGVIAAQTGDYQALFKYSGREIAFPVAGVLGEELVVGVSGLNENFTFYFYILDPDGARVNLVDGVTYDCFSITTHAPMVGEVPTPVEECDPVTIVDQDENVLAVVQPGEVYQVTVLDEVNDEDPYETNIVIDDED